MSAESKTEDEQEGAGRRHQQLAPHLAGRAASSVRTAIGIALLAVAAVFGRDSGEEPGDIVIAVPGIPGPYCAYGIEKRLLELPAVRDVDIDWAREEIRVRVDGPERVPRAEIRRLAETAVERADYPYDYTVRP